MWGGYFNDDEHTAADGAYVRLMKSRKWLYLASGLAIASATGRLHAEALTSLLQGVLVIDNQALAWIIGVGLLVTGTQYALLLWQFWTTYDLVLSARLHRAVSDRIADVGSQLAGLDRRVDLLTQELEEGPSTAKAGQPAHLVVNRTDAGRPPLPTDPEPRRQWLIHDIESEVTRRSILTAERRDLIYGNPRDRAGFVGAERALDALRVGPPLLIFLVSVAFFVPWVIGLWRA